MAATLLTVAIRDGVGSAMGTQPSQNLQATVTRFTIAKLQRIQFLIPLGLVASTLARRLPGILTLALALGVMLAFWRVLRSAVRRLGMQTVRFESEALWIGRENIHVARNEVVRWTFSNGVAALLCQGTTYRLRSRRGRDSELADCLRSLLGPPTRLEKRGSPKARLIAGSSMIGGLAAVACGITYDIMPLGVVGVPTMLIGFGIFAALSTRRIVGG
jgi:hypothetical protein